MKKNFLPHANARALGIITMRKCLEYLMADKTKANLTLMVSAANYVIILTELF